MAEIINLRGVRKARAKRDDKAQAAANRQRFGRSAGQRERDRLAAEAAARKLDSAKLDPEAKR